MVCQITFNLTNYSGLFPITENFDTIVKNDRVQWVRKGDTPLSGVVLSIFKKEGKLHAKIRLVDVFFLNKEIKNNLCM